jgi:hypothetical protein
MARRRRKSTGNVAHRFTFVLECFRHEKREAGEAVAGQVGLVTSQSGAAPATVSGEVPT